MPDADTGSFIEATPPDLNSSRRFRLLEPSFAPSTSPVSAKKKHNLPFERWRGVVGFIQYLLAIRARDVQVEQ